MPRKGLRQPWRVLFVWEADGNSGVIKGCNTYGSESDAQLFVDALRRRAAIVERTIAIKVVNRLNDPTPNEKHYEALTERAMRGY